MKITNEIKTKLIELSKRGLTQKNIAEKIGCSQNTICYHINKKFRKRRIENSKKYFNNLSKEKQKEKREKQKEYQREYQRKKYKEDDKFREKQKDRAREYQRKKYKEDDKFREKQKEIYKKVKDSLKKFEAQNKFVKDLAKAREKRQRGNSTI